MTLLAGSFEAVADIGHNKLYFSTRPSATGREDASVAAIHHIDRRIGAVSPTAAGLYPH